MHKWVCSRIGLTRESSRTRDGSVDFIFIFYVKCSYCCGNTCSYTLLTLYSYLNRGYVTLLTANHCARSYKRVATQQSITHVIYSLYPCPILGQPKSDYISYAILLILIVRNKIKVTLFASHVKFCMVQP